MRKTLTAVLTVASLSGCALFNAVSTGQPLSQTQVQSDLANATYLMQAAGCLATSAAAAAAPIIAVAGDAQGNQVLAATSASGAVLCQMTVPATALPVPAPANAAPATATASAKPAA